MFWKFIMAAESVLVKATARKVKATARKTDTIKFTHTKRVTLYLSSAGSVSSVCCSS